MHIESEGTCCGFDFKVVRNPLGFRCGYVKIPEGHPWYGKDYFDIPEVGVHGGLTYSDKDGLEYLQGFWIGFDCAHCFDMPCPDDMDKDVRGTLSAKIMLGTHKPEFIRKLEIFASEFFGEDYSVFDAERKVRNRLYVESQCKNLAVKALEASKTHQK